LIVAIVGAMFLSDRISPTEYLGVAILGGGIALMARGVFTDGESRKLLPFAFGSAAATATYTIIDALGARISGDAVAYVGWVFIADGLLFTTGMLALRGRGILPVQPRAWLMGTIASAASYGAYAISVWAMTRAPIAVVAALRETSILFAVLIGWLVFGERMTRDKAMAAGLIVAGVIVTRL
jgi:drug/metabolite transporter (DMT)-like permease